MTSVLEVEQLSVRIPTEDGNVHAVQEVSFSVEAGTIFGIVGESGSGKSVLTQAISGLMPFAEITGSARFDGVDLLTMRPEELQSMRGRRIGMIFQDPLSSLHPYYTIGSQITELIHAHERVSPAAAKARTIELLAKVGISDAGTRFSSYPHQFSGGMRQRVMIAMALALNPPLIIADEPTTALDVTVQAQIIELLQEVQQESGATIVMITHDLGLLSTIASDVMVMYAGNRMEIGARAEIFGRPAHPYTAGLLLSSPANYTPGEELVPIPGRPPSLLQPAALCPFLERCESAVDDCRRLPPPVRVYADGGRSACWLEHKAPATERRPATVAARKISRHRAANVLAASVQDVRLTYRTGPLGRRKSVPVLKGIDLEIHRGETLGLVGESGCGKTTLARVIAGLAPVTEGVVTVAGADLQYINRAAWRRMRREVQLVFQDPFGSLNPRRRVGSIIGDPYRIHERLSGAQRRSRVQSLMELVGLNPEHYNRFPSEFSGGQRQRIGIARALALQPELIICDEPVSALDVSIQAQILNLLKSLQQEFGLTYLFISHDLAVVRHICDRIAVMDGGMIIELADADSIYDAPQQEFTRTLLSASMSRPYPISGQPRTLVESLSAPARPDGVQEVA
ncbi:ABC transporter ATP-binding protein [Microlunatus endophyticus]|uniref:ABC transporter ATP-binding protein n=1 Tax=Microlunatus endophyticus TaxID=1716077 RepID=A0A917RZU0_9ACTN|nr:ABC transporter ATP-binding protein [Microlunatus endophyticus]GGL47594.1 ABC transporter ATP-binding protein [Microlunatus endophyticus]